MVMAALDDTSAATLYGFAEALKHANGPASRFSLAVYYLASDRERGEPASGLTLLVMRSALRDSSRDSAFVDRLEDAGSSFWKAVRDALVAIHEPSRSVR